MNDKQDPLSYNKPIAECDLKCLDQPLYLGFGIGNFWFGEKGKDPNGCSFDFCVVDPTELTPCNFGCGGPAPTQLYHDNTINSNIYYGQCFYPPGGTEGCTPCICTDTPKPTPPPPPPPPTPHPSPPSPPSPPHPSPSPVPSPPKNNVNFIIIIIIVGLILGGGVMLMNYLKTRKRLR